MPRLPDAGRPRGRLESRYAIVTVVTVAMLSLTGCDSWRSVFNIQEINLDKSYAQSAAFRNIYTRPRVTNDQSKILCPEPSPDAIAVAANAFAASIGVTGKGSGGVSSANAEAAMSLFARSQAIQAVRDTVTAACVAYQNGVMPRFGYHMVIAAYPDLLLNAMAIEGATDRPLHQPGVVAAAVPGVSVEAKGDNSSASVTGTPAAFGGSQPSPSPGTPLAADAIKAIGAIADGAIDLTHVLQTACLIRMGDPKKDKSAQLDALCSGAFKAPPNAAALDKKIMANAKSIKDGLKAANDKLSKLDNKTPDQALEHALGKAYLDLVKDMISKAQPKSSGQ